MEGFHHSGQGLAQGTPEFSPNGRGRGGGHMKRPGRDQGGATDRRDGGGVTEWKESGKGRFKAPGLTLSLTGVECDQL